MCAGVLRPSWRHALGNKSCEPLLHQLLEKWSHVARQSLRVYIMLLRKTVKNSADRARFGEHAPDFGRHRIEVEIGTRARAQNNDAPVDASCGQLSILNQNTVDCNAQSL